MTRAAERECDTRISDKRLVASVMACSSDGKLQFTILGTYAENRWYYTKSTLTKAEMRSRVRIQRAARCKRSFLYVE